MRRLGTVATLYGDHNDRLLTFAELLSGKRSLGRLWAPLGVGAGSIRHSDAHSEHERDVKRQVAPQPQDGSGFTEYRNEDPSEFVDLDVVDTSWLQAGIPPGSPGLVVNMPLRHTHFCFNQLTVDDVRELIVDGRRAAQRTSRLRWHSANVYHFLVP